MKQPLNAEEENAADEKNNLEKPRQKEKKNPKEDAKHANPKNATKNDANPKNVAKQKKIIYKFLNNNL